MICQDCKDSNHGPCRGDTWCDCQHRGFDASARTSNEKKQETEPSVSKQSTFIDNVFKRWNIT